VPKDVIDEALDKKKLHFVQNLSMNQVLQEISEELERDIKLPLRICIPALGSAAWGDLTPQVGYMMDVTKETLPTNGKIIEDPLFLAFAEGVVAKALTWVCVDKPCSRDIDEWGGVDGEGGVGNRRSSDDIGIYR